MSNATKHGIRLGGRRVKWDFWSTITLVAILFAIMFICYPFLYLLWTLGGRGKRYSLLDCICQECYYRHLFEGFSEDTFNKEYNMSNRMPNGVLITEDKHTNE